MAADAHKNFASSLVATAPSPATSGTSLVVTTGDGTKFPAAPFNATIWPAGANPTTATAEIVRVTAVSTDTLTITRTQESTSARTVIVGDQIVAGITAKTLTDVEGLAAVYTPSMNGLIAASFDPGFCTTTLGALDGNITLTRVYLPTAGTITNVCLWVTVAQSGTIFASNFAAVYSTAGTLLGSTASLSTALTTTGFKALALATPITGAAVGYYYIATLTNESSAAPSLASRASLVVTGIGDANNSAGSGTARAYQSSASFPTSTAAMPSSITLTSGYVLSDAANRRWVGLS